MRADSESVQVLVLARDRSFALESLLIELGFHLARAVAGEHEAEHELRTTRPDAVVFEAGTAGEGFLDRARRADPSCALVAWLTGSSSSMAADLFELGADEVLHEGMGQREVGARISAAVRRSRVRPSRPVQLGALRIDDVNGEAEWAGQDLGLTRREREVLHALVDSGGKTMRREVLYKRVWGYAMARGDRSVDVNVKRLRSKLAKLAGSELEIKTQPGIGYRLELVESREPADPVTAL
ncbi:MAG: response regulator transcription factor [Actinobacteria bacterium]|nr:MAG: response regulator transcription factor [Actinomycetota bacterium]